MKALQRLIDLGDSNKFEEMSTAEFVIYTEWVAGGKIDNEFLDEAAAEISALQAVTEAARKYLEYSFVSDRRKLQDTLRDYDHVKALQ
jgi:hypothetical protein